MNTKRVSLILIVLFSFFQQLLAESEDSVLFKVNYFTSSKLFADRETFQTDEMILEVGEKKTSFYSKWRKMRKERMDSLKSIGITDSWEIVGKISNLPRNNFNYEIYENIPEKGLRTVYCKHLNTIYYEEESEAPEWSILEKDSVILDYKCKMAKGTFRGHTWTVWYSDEIPLASGPWKLKGLPGLILSAYDDNGLCSFEAIELNNGNGESLYTRTDKGIKGTRKLEAELRDLMYSDNDAYMKRMGFPGGARVVGKDGRMEKISPQTPVMMED